MLPKQITLNKPAQLLEIVWQDEEVCRYPLSHLREACPCVECRGGHQYMGMEFAPTDLLRLVPKRNYGLVGLNPMGNYALQPVWEDGHSTGIYTWEYLRYICPKTNDTD